MSADLMVSFVEIRKDKQPDFGEARIWLDAMADKDVELSVLAVSMADSLVDQFEIVEQDEEKAHAEAIIHARDRLELALNSVADGWNGNHSMMIKIFASKTDLLIAGGETWGDSLDQVDDITYFWESGMARAAGFLV